MLNIRLQRTGKRGQAFFRIVVVEHTKKPKGKYLELLGNYNPHQKKFTVNKERVEYWISKGAQATPTVNNLMVNYKVWDKPKMESWKPKKRTAADKQQITAKESVSAQETTDQASGETSTPEPSTEASPEQNASQ